MLSSLRRRSSQDVLRRGFATHQQGQGRAATHHQGRRPPPAPPAPPSPPEKIEWWAVDGELFKAEKFDPKRVLAPLDNDHIPNRIKRKQRIKHLGQTRLKLRVHGQESYWAAYMRRFQAMRDEWERHVWDPIPVPAPKPRNPVWAAEESEKYVWKDARREAYTFDVSRMDYSGAKPRFDNKIGYKVQGMNRYPVEGQRDSGGSSVRSETTLTRGDSYKDSRSYENARKDERYGHQRSADLGRRNSRKFEYDNFDDVFAAEDAHSADAKDAHSGGKDATTEKKKQSGRHGKQAASMSTEDDEDGSSVEFSWDESDGEEDDEKDEDVSKHWIRRERASQPSGRGWHVKEEDLFNDV